MRIHHAEHFPSFAYSSSSFVGILAFSLFTKLLRNLWSVHNSAIYSSKIAFYRKERDFNFALHSSASEFIQTINQNYSMNEFERLFRCTEKSFYFSFAIN